MLEFVDCIVQGYLQLIPGFFRSRLKFFPCQPARFFYLFKLFLSRGFFDIPCLELSAIFNYNIRSPFALSALAFSSSIFALHSLSCAFSFWMFY
jgi:hypothetical protein